MSLSSRRGTVNHLYLIRICSIAASCHYSTGFELGRANAIFNSEDYTYTMLFIFSLLIGLCLGSLTVKFLCTCYGRKTLMIVSACIVLVGTGIVRHSQSIHDNPFMTFIGRAISGFGCGIGSAVAPIYSKVSLVKEYTPGKLCSKYGGLNQVFLTLGIVSAILVSYLGFGSYGSLDWGQVGLMIFFALILVQLAVFVLFMPESQHWDRNNGNEVRAASVSRRLYINPGDVVAHNLEVQSDLEARYHQAKRRIVSALCTPYSVIAFSFNSGGFNFVLNFSINIYVTGALFLSFILNVLVITYSDRKLYPGFNRKTVFVVGLIAMSCITLVHGVLLVSSSHTETAHTILVALFIFAFMSSVGPFFWIYIPELLKIDDLCYPLICLWSTQILMTVVYILDLSNAYPYYFLFSALSLVLAGFIHRFAIETSGGVSEEQLLS
jgi:MFS family permease